MQSAKDVLSQMRQTNTGRVVRDWQSMIPKGSRWNPGDPGDPNCQVCEGTGYVRFDLPVGHPNFGKVFYCDCVAQMQSHRAGQHA